MNRSNKFRHHCFKSSEIESTLSSIVSNLVSKIPSINLGLGVVERSANFCNRNRSEAQITPNYRILIEQIILKKETKKSLRNNRWQSGIQNSNLIELWKLINSIISDQCLSNKQDKIWIVKVNKLWECSHQRFIILKSKYIYRSIIMLKSILHLSKEHDSERANMSEKLIALIIFES